MTRIIPFAVVILLFVILYYGLYSNPSHELPSQLINGPLPTFSMENLLDKKERLTNDTFKQHPYSLLNFWATWCYACRLEHQTLMKIKTTYNIPIYAIAYKDSPEAISTWLEKRGNPYAMLAIDHSGDVIIDFGIYGTPETFLINDKGQILYRHVGALTEKVWLEKILPLTQRHRG